MYYMNQVSREEIRKQIQQDVAEMRKKSMKVNSQLANIHSLCMQLDKLGYQCDIKKSSDIIDVIEKHHIDTSKLTFVEGSYAAFKDAIHNGVYARFDEDYDDMFITDEERKFRDDEIAAGRLFRIR